MLINCREAGAVILKISYGYTVEPHDNDPLVDLARKAMDQFGQAGVPGAWMVDMMPFCEHYYKATLQMRGKLIPSDSKVSPGLVSWNWI
jgi:hypothetical protein